MKPFDKVFFVYLQKLSSFLYLAVVIELQEVGFMSGNDIVGTLRIPLREIMDRKCMGENMQDAVEVEMIPRPTISEEVPVNWGLWNEDGSLNGGLVLFSGLCAACAAVWSALLMQCAGGCYRQQGAMSSPQFIMLPGYSDSDDEDVDEDPKTVLKRQQKQNEGIVIAAEYITKP